MNHLDSYVIPFEKLYAVAINKEGFEHDEILIALRRDDANNQVELITADLEVHFVRYETIQQVFYDWTLKPKECDLSLFDISECGRFLITPDITISTRVLFNN